MGISVHICGLLCFDVQRRVCVVCECLWRGMKIAGFLDVSVFGRARVGSDYCDDYWAIVRGGKVHMQANAGF